MAVWSMASTGPWLSTCPETARTRAPEPVSTTVRPRRPSGGRRGRGAEGHLGLGARRGGQRRARGVGDRRWGSAAGHSGGRELLGAHLQLGDLRGLHRDLATRGARAEAVHLVGDLGQRLEVAAGQHDVATALGVAVEREHRADRRAGRQARAAGVPRPSMVSGAEGRALREEVEPRRGGRDGGTAVEAERDADGRDVARRRRGSGDRRRRRRSGRRCARRRRRRARRGCARRGPPIEVETCSLELEAGDPAAVDQGGSGGVSESGAPRMPRVAPRS